MLCFSFLSTGDRVPRRPQKGVFVPCLFHLPRAPRGLGEQVGRGGGWERSYEAGRGAGGLIGG